MQVPHAASSANRSVLVRAATCHRPPAGIAQPLKLRPFSPAVAPRAAELPALASTARLGSVHAESEDLSSEVDAGGLAGAPPATEPQRRAAVE